MRADYEAGVQFLEWYRPHHMLLGNHDNRLWDLQYGVDQIRADYAQRGVQEILLPCARSWAPPCIRTTNCGACSTGTGRSCATGSSMANTATRNTCVSTSTHSFFTAIRTRAMSPQALEPGAPDTAMTATVFVTWTCLTHRQNLEPPNGRTDGE